VNNARELAETALIELGLTPYQAKVYLAIADGKERTASEIASLARVPQPRIYEILDSLTKLGIVEEILAKPRRYRGVPPAEAVERLADHASRKILEKKETALQVLRQNITYTTASSKFGVKIIRNYSELLRRAREMLLSAKYEILIAATPELLLEIIEDPELYLNKPGRLTALVSFEANPPFHAEAPWIGIRRRAVRVLPIIIVDSAKSLVFQDENTLEITDEGLLRLLNDFFNHSVWRVSQTVKEIQALRGLEYTSTSLWLMREVISDVLKKGYQTIVSVNGVERKSGKMVEVSGKPLALQENSFGVTLALVLDVGGKKLTVGGRGARFEDIEGHIFKVKIL